MNQYKYSLIQAIPLFLVILIDGMGLGLIFPLLNDLLFNVHDSILATATSPSIRSASYALLVGVFYLCWFFGAAIISDLSDSVGRKKALLICLLGSFFGFFISALAIFFKSYLLLLLGRIVAGFTTGSQPVAQAAIIDISPKEKRAVYLSAVLFAVSIGFILGPILGGVLSDKQIIHWFTMSTPFYFGAIFAFLNIIVLIKFYQQPDIKGIRKPIKIYRSVEVFIDAFKHKSVRFFSADLLIMQLGWGTYYTFCTVYLVKVLNFSALSISLYMGVMGLGFAIGFAALVNIVSKYVTAKTATIGAFSITAFCIFLTWFIGTTVSTWILIIPMAAAGAVGYAFLLSLFSNQVDETKQGWVMGISGAVVAAAYTLMSAMNGLLGEISAAMPIIASFIFMGISAVFLIFFKSGADKT